jgi:hypothetical protein
MPLITLDAAKAHLYIAPDDTRDDVTLSAVVAEASDTILVYLKRDPLAPVWDETTTPPRVQAAVKIYLGYLWRARDDQAEAQRTWDAIENHLRRDRDPALA